MRQREEEEDDEKRVEWDPTSRKARRWYAAVYAVITFILVFGQRKLKEWEINCIVHMSEIATAIKNHSKSALLSWETSGIERWSLALGFWGGVNTSSALQLNVIFENEVDFDSCWNFFLCLWTAHLFFAVKVDSCAATADDSYGAAQ